MKRVLFAIFVAALPCMVAQASPITYSLTTTATGTFGTSAFTNALVTVTLIGDTTNVMPGPAPNNDVVVNSGIASVNVSGIGTGTFLDQIVIVSTLGNTNLLGGPAVVILDNTSGAGILVQTGSTFLTYNLRSSIGPISGTGGVASGSQMTPIFPTTAGNLTWAIGQTLGNSTFTAVTTAPEPSALFLLGSGMAVVFARRRFKRVN